MTTSPFLSFSNLFIYFFENGEGGLEVDGGGDDDHSDGQDDDGEGKFEFVTSTEQGSSQVWYSRNGVDVSGNGSVDGFERAGCVSSMSVQPRMRWNTIRLYWLRLLCVPCLKRLRVAHKTVPSL